MNFEMQQKYNMLKEKNRQRNAEIKYRENYLFMDCIKNLVHYKILKKEESEKVIRNFLNIVPFDNGHIDWTYIQNKSLINMDEFEKIGVNQEKYYIIWDNVELPCVSCELKSIKEHLDDVLAVSFDTWLLSEEGGEIIEFYHEGKITYGKIVKE